MMSEPFRLLVCGGRDYADRRALYAALDAVHAKRPVTLLIHGAARGADTLAGEWAEARGVPVLPFEVTDWRRADGSLDKSAGPRRNRRMFAEGKPDGAVAFPPGPKGDKSGTADMARVCIDGGIKVWFVGWPPEFETTRYKANEAPPQVSASPPPPPGEPAEVQPVAVELINLILIGAKMPPETASPPADTSTESPRRTALAARPWRRP